MKLARLLFIQGAHRMDRDDDTLQQQVLRLEQENAELRQRLADSEANSRVARLIQQAVGAAPIVFYVKDMEGRFLYSNPRHSELLGCSPEEIVSKYERDIVEPQVASTIEDATRRVLALGQSEQMEFDIPIGGTQRSFHETIFPVQAEENVIAVAGVSIDVTARKEAENVIQAQRALIHDLSTPLIPLADGVLAVPLIGSIDALRMSRVTETLLHRIGAHQIAVVLLDLTGIRGLNSESASALVSLARAVGLLGAQVFLTGIRPDVARLLIDDGIEIGNIPTFSTLQAGIASALPRVQRASARSAR